MTEEATEGLARAKEKFDLFFPIVGALHRRQRAALHVVFQCAEAAMKAGNLEEAERMYGWLGDEFQSLFHEPWSTLGIPDYVSPPTHVVGNWLAPEMLAVADRATTSSAETNASAGPVAAAKLIYMILPPQDCAQVVGDLDEEYEQHVVPRFGTGFARRWYWKQAIATTTQYVIIVPMRTCMEYFKEIIVDIIKGFFDRGS